MLSVKWLWVVTGAAFQIARVPGIIPEEAPEAVASSVPRSMKRASAFKVQPGMNSFPSVPKPTTQRMLT